MLTNPGCRFGVQERGGSKATMVRVKDATVRSRSFLGLRKCNTLWSHDASDLSEKASRFQITPRARARSLLPRPAHLLVARKQPRTQANRAGGASVATAAAKAAGPDVPKGWEKVNAGELHYLTSWTGTGGRARRRRSRCTFDRGALRTRGSARMGLGAALERGSRKRNEHT